MSSFKVGDNVRHTVLNVTGKVVSVRDDPDGYDYLVEWINADHWVYPTDWFRVEVLEAI